MFYRRKILLALLETFGGSLASVDCQNLLLLFCRRRGKNYYDFFSYIFGAHSFLLFQDKARLVSLGFLVDVNAFVISAKERFFSQIHEEDQSALCTLSMEIGEMRGEQLMRKVYLECPFIASHSKIVSSILSCSEYARVRETRNTDTTPCLFTLGYEGLSIDAYINILLANNITTLIDVRKNSLSMKYGFSKTKLRDYLKEVGIAYVHLPNLGIPSALRKELHSKHAYESLFDHYRLYILPEQKEAIEQVKTIVSTQGRAVLTCFEADAQSCHRHEITEYLERDVNFDLPVIHLNKTCTCNAFSVYTTVTNILLVFPEHVSVAGD